MNKLTTSKLTRISSLSNLVCSIFVMNSLEFTTLCSDFPTRGFNISARYLAKLQVGEPWEATMGLRGTSGL